MTTERIVLGLVIFIGMGSIALAEDHSRVTGHWSGAVIRKGAVQLLNISFEKGKKGLRGTIDIPELGMFAEPLKNLKYDHPKLSFRFVYGPFSCIVHPTISEITGINAKWGPPVGIHLKRGEWAQRRITKTEVVFPSDKLRLNGTLILPPDGGPHAAVVLLHGSGQSGREDNWTYRGLAYVLAQNGIAALIYDKRPANELAGGSTFDRLADDAVAATQFLTTRPEIDPSRIGLFGASQGGWIAPLAASRCKDIAFVILHAGPAVSVWDQEVHRVIYSMQADGLPRDQIDAAGSFAKEMFAFVRSGRGWSELASRAKQIRKEPWAKYLQVPESREDAMEWRREDFDPKPVLRKLKCPVLAFFGEDDTLVPPAENVALMERYLKEAGNRHVKTVVLENVGHGFELNSSLVGDDWNWPEGFWFWPRKAPGYYDTMVSWIRQRSKSDR